MTAIVVVRSMFPFQTNFPARFTLLVPMAAAKSSRVRPVVWKLDTWDHGATGEWPS
jgi:hypothetical protein